MGRNLTYASQLDGLDYKLYQVGTAFHTHLQSAEPGRTWLQLGTGCSASLCGSVELELVFWSNDTVLTDFRDKRFWQTTVGFFCVLKNGMFTRHWHYV